MTTPEFTVVASDLLTIDPTICQCWLTGLSINEAIQRERRHRPQRSLDLLSRQVAAQYAELALLEPSLHRPHGFMETWLFQAPLGVKRRLIHGYYRLDEPVVRELFGKKLSSRLRRDLEPIATRNRIPMISCRRQFDNIKRVLKQVEDLEGRSLGTEIERRFLLPSDLAGRYVNILFACHHRFDTSKRKLQRYRAIDFEHCCHAMMTYWTERSYEFDDQQDNSKSAYPSASTIDIHGRHPNDTLEAFDDQLVQDIRELRTVITSNRLLIEKLRIAIAAQGAPSFDMQRNSSALVANHPQGDFRNLLRVILTIGSNLTNTKEMRNLFITLLEKIVEPCAAYGWSPAELDTFFTTLANALNDCLSTTTDTSMESSRQQHYCVSFSRFIDGLRACCVRLHRGLVAAHVAGFE